MSERRTPLVNTRASAICEDVVGQENDATREISFP